MSERVDAVLVDVRHGACRAKFKVAADERDADGVAWLQRSLERFLAGPACGDAAAGRNEALFPERTGQQVGKVRLEAGHHERRRDRLEPHTDLRSSDSANRTRAQQFRVAWTFGKRPVPVERASKCRGQVLAIQRELDAHFCGRRTRVGERGGVRHFSDGRNPRDGFLRELSE